MGKENEVRPGQEARLVQVGHRGSRLGGGRSDLEVRGDWGWQPGLGNQQHRDESKT